MGSQGKFSKRKTSKPSPGWAECSGDEFQEAGMVDTEFWGSERIEEILERSWRAQQEAGGKWRDTRWCCQRVYPRGTGGALRV